MKYPRSLFVWALTTALMSHPVFAGKEDERREADAAAGASSKRVLRVRAHVKGVDPAPSVVETDKGAKAPELGQVSVDANPSPMSSTEEDEGFIMETIAMDPSFWAADQSPVNSPLWPWRETYNRGFPRTKEELRDTFYTQRFFLEMHQGIFSEDPIPQDISRKRKTVITRSLGIYNQIQKGRVIGGCKSIPLRFHRVWLTSNEKPYDPPAKILDNYIASLKNCPIGAEHFFWCFDPKKIPETVKRLEATQLITVRKVAELFEGPYESNPLFDPASRRFLAKHLFRAYLEDSRYCQAGDILKQWLALKYGGVYSDLGVLIKSPLAPILENYDYILYVIHNGWIDQGLIGVPAGCDFYKQALLLMHNYCHLIKGDRANFWENFSTPGKQLGLTCGIPMQIFMDKLLPDDARVFFTGLKWDNDPYFAVARQGTHAQADITSPRALGNRPVEKSTLNIFEVPWSEGEERNPEL